MMLSAVYNPLRKRTPLWFALLGAVACSELSSPGAAASCPNAVSVTISPPSVLATVGDTVTFSWAVSDQTFHALSCSVGWETDASVLRSLGSGRFVALKGGNVAVKAVSGVATSTTSLATVITTPIYVSRRYNVVDLTASAGDSATFIQLNANGEVLVRKGDAGFIWQAGALTPLPGCGRPFVFNRNAVVLCARPALSLWQNGTITVLPTIDSVAPFNLSLDLNDSGLVAAVYNDEAACESGCIFKYMNGQVTRPSYPIYNPMYASMMINNAGDMLIGGETSDYDSSYHLIHTKSGAIESFDFGLGSAYALNDSGWVAGLDMGHLDNGAAFFIKNGTTTDFAVGEALSINNHGAIVGQLSTWAPSSYPTFDFNLPGPFLWENGYVSLLTRAAIDPAWTVKTARQINDAGQILGAADDSTARVYNHAVLLQPGR
jgi:hypothetical protein